MTAPATSRWPLPPHHLFRDFLAPEEHAALLGWALACEPLLRESRVAGATVDPAHRISRSLPLRETMGPWHEMLVRRVGAALPDLFAKSGVKPFLVSRLVLELVVYGDGARFRPHRDTLRAGAAAEADRILTGVYYLYAEPKAFDGGALRLHRFGSAGTAVGDYVDIEPEQNTLLVFPSWAIHEVRTVGCPSGRFEDSRFAVNIWLYRARPDLGPALA